MVICRCFTDLQCDGYSFTMWLKFSTATLVGRRGIFSSVGRGKNKVRHGGVALLIANGYLALHFKLTEGTKRWKAKSVRRVQDNTWIHVAGTWTVGGAAKLYIDGVLNDTESEEIYLEEDPFIQNTMHVGTFAYSGEARYGNFLLDEWYFWDSELSADQVAKVYAAYQTGSSKHSTISK